LVGGRTRMGGIRIATWSPFEWLAEPRDTDLSG
jgi:hypothetical protein